jgi:hypothetical protein
MGTVQNIARAIRQSKIASMAQIIVMEMALAHIGNDMAQNMLGSRAVGHDVGGKLRQIFRVEKTHGKLSDMFGNADP